MNIKDKLSKVWEKGVKPALELGGILTVVGIMGKVVYDREFRDDPEVYKGFPTHFEPKDVTIYKPNGGKVISDIIFVEMLPSEMYKKFNINDSSVAYEGNFKYTIRPKSSGIFSTDYGSAIRHGRVEGIQK